MKRYTILILVIAAFALGGVGCDDGRGHASSRSRPSSPQRAPTNTTKPKNAPSKPKPTSEPAQAERQAEEAQSTAADLGQAITTLGEVCGAAQETRRALLTKNYNAGNAADQSAKEVEHHGDK